MSKKIFRIAAFSALSLFLPGFWACKSKPKPASTTTNEVKKETKAPASTGQVEVLISTPYGDMKARLYNETPQHRDNFVKLVEKGYYDSLIFHRVINNFMIQGGDPESRKAKPEQMLGNGGPGYTIPAEFNSKLYHKKGALCAAREGDDVNPQKASSGSQFYIVQGRVIRENDLSSFEYRINRPILTQITQQVTQKPENAKIMEEINRLKQEGKQDSLMIKGKLLDEQILAEYKKTPHFEFSAEQKNAYTTIGGTPHLDGSYTVFGEVYEGLDVIDKIAAAPTGANDRPRQDIRMTMKIIRKK
ncbi:MAG: peptidylprolyl isomerase [Bacteroidia bacterium]